jgi:hypothetical protein
MRLYKSGALKDSNHSKECFKNLATFVDALDMEIQAHFWARHIDVDDESGLHGSYDNFVKLREALNELLPKEADEDYMVMMAKRIIDSGIEDPLKEEEKDDNDDE